LGILTLFNGRQSDDLSGSNSALPPAAMEPDFYHNLIFSCLFQTLNNDENHIFYFPQTTFFSLPYMGRICQPFYGKKYGDTEKIPELSKIHGSRRLWLASKGSKKLIRY
jgi:hypothetical protein